MSWGSGSTHKWNQKLGSLILLVLKIRLVFPVLCLILQTNFFSKEVNLISVLKIRVSSDSMLTDWNHNRQIVTHQSVPTQHWYIPGHLFLSFFLSFFASSYTHLSWPWYQSTRLTWESSSEFIAGGDLGESANPKYECFCFQLVQERTISSEWVKSTHKSGRRVRSQAGVRKEGHLEAKHLCGSRLKGTYFQGQTEWDNWMNQQQQNWPLSLSLSLSLHLLTISLPTSQWSSSLCPMNWWAHG